MLKKELDKVIQTSRALHEQALSKASLEHCHTTSVPAKENKINVIEHDWFIVYSEYYPSKSTHGHEETCTFQLCGQHVKIQTFDSKGTLIFSFSFGEFGPEH